MLKERSERKWPQLGAFTGLSIQGRNPGGGVKTLEIQGENQNATLENEYAIRKFLSVKGLSVSRNDGSVCDTMELLPSACFIVDYRWRLWAWCGDESERSKASCRKWSWLAGHSADFLSEYYYRKLARILKK